MVHIEDAIFPGNQGKQNIHRNVHNHFQPRDTTATQTTVDAARFEHNRTLTTQRGDTPAASALHTAAIRTIHLFQNLQFSIDNNFKETIQTGLSDMMVSDAHNKFKFGSEARPNNGHLYIKGSPTAMDDPVDESSQALPKRWLIFNSLNCVISRKTAELWKPNNAK